MKPLSIVLAVLIVAGEANLQIAFGQATHNVDLSKEKYQAAVLMKSNKVSQIPSTQKQLTLKKGDLLAARLAGNAVATKTGDTLRYRIPYEISFATPTGGKVKMQPVIKVEGGGFRPRRGIRGFSGSLQLGLENVDDPTSTDQLDQDVHILVTAVADSVSRPDVRLRHTNQPFEPVAIFATSPSDSVEVDIQPSFDRAGIKISIPVLRPTLSVSLSPKGGIPGYGLATATINVQIEGVPDPAGLVVTLTSDKSEPEPSRVVLDASGGAQASIRSAGRGRATIAASNRLADPANGSIAFLFPMAFLIFATIGGLLGGAAKFFRDKFDSSRTGKMKKVSVYLIAGLVFGFIVAGLSAIGINVSPVKPTANGGEALVCFLSALGGFGGPTLLSGFLGLTDKAKDK